MNINLDKSTEVNISIRKNTYLGLLFEVTESDVDIDLTNYEIEMHLKADSSQETPDRIYNQTNGKIVSGNGYFTVKDTITLDKKVYYYDLRIVNESLEVSYWIYGTIKVTDNITEVV
jgi:hypothetical protein